VVEKQDAELQCASYGDPSPHIEWFKDGKLLGNSPAVTITHSVLSNPIHSVSHLLLQNASRSQSGEYAIQASNQHGTCRKTIILDGKYL